MKGNIFRYFTTCESLLELEVNHRGGSRVAATSGMDLFVATANSFYQLFMVKKTYALDVETLLSLSWAART